MEQIEVPPKPKKPLNMYFLYVEDHMNDVKEKYPNLEHKERMKKISEMYK